MNDNSNEFPTNQNLSSEPSPSQKQFIPTGEIIVHESIAAGGFGEINRAYVLFRDAFGNERRFPSVIKGIHTQEKKTDTLKSLVYLEREGAILDHLLTNPYIVKGVPVFIDNIPHILMEDLSMSYRTLKNVVREGSFYGNRTSAILEQVHQALSLSAKWEIYHGDLSPNNIMINSSDAVKIIDFGVNWLVLGRKYFAGTPGYIVPELFKDDREFTDQSTVYSFGLLAFEMLTGQTFFDKNSVEFFIYFSNEKYSSLQDIVRGSNQKKSKDSSYWSNYSRLMLLQDAHGEFVSKRLLSLPKNLHGVIGRAVQYNRSQRFENIEKFMTELKQQLGIQDLPTQIHTDDRQSQSTQFLEALAYSRLTSYANSF